MSGVLDSIVKLPRYVRILSTNGLDQNNAIVDKQQEDKDVKSQRHYKRKDTMKKHTIIITSNIKRNSKSITANITSKTGFSPSKKENLQ